jgi:DNA-binding transcriptional LysR family regulator
MSDSEHLDFRLLKYIVAIAEAGTFTAAAARLHLSQSALSTQVRTLEDNLGIKIFDREHGTALTPEGKVLVRYGREGLRTRDHIVQTIQAIHAGRMTPLRLAFTSFVLNPLLKTVSDLYRELIPDSDIFPESGDTEEAIVRLRDGDCDAALVTLPTNGEGLNITILERERLVVCMRNDDPLAVYEAVPASALNEKISVFTYQKHHPVAYERLIQMFAELGVTTRPCKPTMNVDHVQWIVKEGGCYSLIRAGRHLAPGLIARPIAEAEWTIDTAIVCQTDHRNPALSLLIEELTKKYPEAVPSYDKKPVASVRMRETLKPQKNRKEDDQISLFNSKNEG